MEWWVRGVTIAVGQSAESVVRKTEDTKLRMLVEVGVRFCRVVADAKQMIAAAIEL